MLVAATTNGWNGSYSSQGRDISAVGHVLVNHGRAAKGHALLPHLFWGWPL